MAIPGNVKDLEGAKFGESSVTPDRTIIYVEDEAAIDNLAAILIAIGGTSDTTSTVNNVTVTLADTEQAIALPANTKKFLIRSRNNGTIRLAYGVGETSTDYLTINKKAVYTNENFYTSQTIYIQSSVTGDILELETHV